MNSTATAANPAQSSPSATATTATTATQSTKRSQLKNFSLSPSAFARSADSIFALWSTGLNHPLPACESSASGALWEAFPDLISEQPCLSTPRHFSPCTAEEQRAAQTASYNSQKRIPMDRSAASSALGQPSATHQRFNAAGALSSNHRNTNTNQQNNARHQQQPRQQRNDDPWGGTSRDLGVFDEGGVFRASAAPPKAKEPERIAASAVHTAPPITIPSGQEEKMHQAQSPPPSSSKPIFERLRAEAVAQSAVFRKPVYSAVQVEHEETESFAEAERWLYRDPSGNIQGPFANREMLDWFQLGYFPPTLPIKRVSDPGFEPLGQIIQRTGSIPFVSTGISGGLPSGSKLSAVLKQPGYEASIFGSQPAGGPVGREKLEEMLLKDLRLGGVKDDGSSAGVVGVSASSAGASAVGVSASSNYATSINAATNASSNYATSIKATMNAATSAVVNATGNATNNATATPSINATKPTATATPSINASKPTATTIPSINASKPNPLNPPSSNQPTPQSHSTASDTPNTQPIVQRVTWGTQPAHSTGPSIEDLQREESAAAASQKKELSSKQAAAAAIPTPIVSGLGWHTKPAASPVKSLDEIIQQEAAKKETSIAAAAASVHSAPAPPVSRTGPRSMSEMLQQSNKVVILNQQLQAKSTQEALKQPSNASKMQSAGAVSRSSASSTAATASSGGSHAVSKQRHSAELVEWVRKELSSVALRGSYEAAGLDVETFVALLLDLDSERGIREAVEDVLGSSVRSAAFAGEFVRKAKIASEGALKSGAGLPEDEYVVVGKKGKKK